MRLTSSRAILKEYTARGDTNSPSSPYQPPNAKPFLTAATAFTVAPTLYRPVPVTATAASSSENSSTAGFAPTCTVSENLFLPLVNVTVNVEAAVPVKTPVFLFHVQPFGRPLAVLPL